jgi:hypothetical protein
LACYGKKSGNSEQSADKAEAADFCFAQLLDQQQRLNKKICATDKR